jgi:hypothetical protein
MCNKKTVYSAHFEVGTRGLQEHTPTPGRSWGKCDTQGHISLSEMSLSTFQQKKNCFAHVVKVASVFKIFSKQFPQPSQVGCLGKLHEASPG